MFLIVKSFKLLPKHNGYGFIFESFSLNWFFYDINKKETVGFIVM